MNITDFWLVNNLFLWHSMPKDIRYNTISSLIQGGNIKTFSDIFLYIPPSVVYRDLGVNYTRFQKLIANTSLFTLQELITLAGFFKLDDRTMIEMAYSQYETRKKNKRKK